MYQWHNSTQLTFESENPSTVAIFKVMLFCYSAVIWFAGEYFASGYFTTHATGGADEPGARNNRFFLVTGELPQLYRVMHHIHYI